VFRQASDILQENVPYIYSQLCPQLHRYGHEHARENVALLFYVMYLLNIVPYLYISPLTLELDIHSFAQHLCKM